LKPADIKAAAAAEAGGGNSTAASSSNSTPFRSPIIIVPSAVTSCITTQNAVQFLIEGRYGDGSTQNDANTERERVRELVLARPTDPENPRKNVIFKVIDDASKLTSQEWERVVAVFVTGQKWQFARWKYSNPTELFQNCLGIHLTTDEKNVDPVIKSWNCKVLKVQCR
jgi:parafibromin